MLLLAIFRLNGLVLILSTNWECSERFDIAKWMILDTTYYDYDTHFDTNIWDLRYEYIKRLHLHLANGDYDYNIK